MTKKRKASDKDISDTGTSSDVKPKFPPLVSSYNEKIRPILDAIDKLRRLKVTQEGIPLPTIVVVGDQSSGKSSVLESLAGISLPRGQGICTRVPLIMRLQHHSNPVPEFLLEFNNKSVKIDDESHIPKAIDKATSEIAGESKGISNVPITMLVKNKGVPDLTMIDLPGITRVPVRDQPDNIYEQISDIIMEHIKPQESIILNVLSATVDFPTCESIRMSRRVDSTGQRTLAVVTKSDCSPDGLLEKVTTDEVSIGLGYVCVRNRINDETYDEARIQEANLFKTHPLLSKIDKSMVGIDVLADKLVQIQSVIISKCLPNIVNKIQEKLNDLVLEYDKLPNENLTSMAKAMAAFVRVVVSLKEALQKSLISLEYEEQDLENNQVFCNARLVEMLDKFSKELQTSAKFSENFLVEEIRILEQTNSIRLPGSVVQPVFLCLLKRKVNSIAELPINFVNKVWAYLESVCFKILVDNCGKYPHLLPSLKKGLLNLMTKMKNKFKERVVDMIESEKITDYTCDPQFMASWSSLMAKNHGQFSNAMSSHSQSINIAGYGMINVKHLFTVPSIIRDQAFDLKMKLTAYWTIVVKRIVDNLALQLQLRIREFVNKQIESELVNEIIESNGGIQKMMAEPPSVAKNRERLQTSIELLRQSKETMEGVIHDIEVNGE